MKRTRSYVTIVLFLLVIVSLTACTKTLKAPKTEKPKTVKATEQPTEMIDTIYQFATQTAQAALAQPQPQTTPQATAVGPAATLVVVEVVPTATPLPAVIPTLAVPASYTMQKYEFVYCIARRFNVNPNELMAINGLNQYSVINPGQVLKIPQTGNPFPWERALRSHPVTYTVVGGDTIYKIACLFGDVDPLAIAAVNGLTAPYGLNIGQVLNIP